MLRSRCCYCFLCSLIGLGLALLYLLAMPVTVNAQEKKSGKVSFIKDIAPILKENCYACHDATKKKGKLDMTTWKTFRTGGRNDDPIISGNPKASYIIYVLTAKDAARMPPKEVGGPLPKEKIDLIAAWIKQGAKLDKGIEPQANLREVLRARWQPPALLASYLRPALITALAFTPDNKHLVASGYHELTVWNVANGKLEKRIHTRAERAHDLEFLKDGKLVVAGGRPGQEGDVRIYNLNGKSKKVNGVAILDGVNDPSVLVAELVRTNEEIFSIDVSDDGKKLASGGGDRLVRIWDISKGYKKPKLEQTVENHADWVLSVNFSPNGKYLVTASRDKSAKIWVIKTKESLVTFPGHQEYVFGAVMSRDNKQGISAGGDNQVRWWDAVEKSKKLGKQIRNAGGHSKPIFDLVEHREGNKQTLATCSADGTVRLWNAANGQNLKTLSGLKDWVYSVAISPNGKLVAAGGYSGNIRLWNIANGKDILTFNASPGLTRTAATAKKK